MEQNMVIHSIIETRIIATPKTNLAIMEPTNPRLTELIGEQELLDQVVLWEDFAYNPDQLDHTPQHPVPNLPNPAPVQSDFNPQDFMTDEEIAEQFLILQQFSENRKRSREESKDTDADSDELEHGPRKSQRVTHDTTPQSGEVQVPDTDTMVDNIDATVEEMAQHGVPSALNLHNNTNVVPLPLPNNNTDPSALSSVQDIRQ